MVIQLYSQLIIATETREANMVTKEKEKTAAI